MSVLFYGMVLLGPLLMLKNPDALIAGLIYYAIFAVSLVFSKYFLDGKIVEFYRSKYDSDYRTHIRLNRGGWIKEANKAFRVNRWEILTALVTCLCGKAKNLLKKDKTE